MIVGRHAALEDVRVAGDDRQRDREERDAAEDEARGTSPTAAAGCENDVIASKREPQHLAQRVLGHARVALLAHERHGDLREADPHRHPAQEAVALGHRRAARRARVRSIRRKSPDSTARSSPVSRRKVR